MPYIAPEVLRGGPYFQAADIYSFGMIMHFIATGKQHFANCAHNELNICEN
jgi:serine/threonine protein kinase